MPVSPQFDLARSCRAALKTIFLKRAGGSDDGDALARIQELCIGALRAVDDPVCAGRLITIHCCAAALYSDKAHRHWDRPATLGVNVLRRRIFHALNAYQRRLYRLERARLLLHPGGKAPIPRERAPEESIRAESDPPTSDRRQGISPRV